jgi:ABC-type multidrug transport system ATPase subunit
MSTAEPLVSVRGLGKRFGGRSVIAGVDLDVARGDIIGLVGANGGGKTTTLRMLAGLVAPDSGTGQVLGTDIRGRGPRRGIGYMGQALALYADLSVAENLRFRAAVHGGDTAAVAQRYGLGPVLASRVETLSGGWQRRVQFAATLIGAPALLLLDEPTAGLDVATRRDIWAWLGDLAAAGHGIVISTHDLAEAERCPVILHYAAGRAEGPWRVSDFLGASGAGSLEAAVLARGA